jgi:hypothetical protein
MTGIEPARFVSEVQVYFDRQGAVRAQSGFLPSRKVLMVLIWTWLFSSVLTV